MLKARKVAPGDILAFFPPLFQSSFVCRLNCMQIPALQFCLVPRAAVPTAVRRLWNRAVAEQCEAMSWGKKLADYMDMYKSLTAWRNTPAIQSFRQALRFGCGESPPLTGHPG